MDSIIFDLDGTLWNATVPAYEALRLIEEKYGTAPTSFDDFLALIGKPMDQIAAGTLLGLSQERKLELFEEFYKLELELIRKGGSSLYPNLVDSLEKLQRHYPLFIVSNCQEGYIETFLEIHGLGYLFDDYLSWGESPQSKGKNILLMMKRHGLKSPIYVGDTRGDELASAEANIPYFHVDFGFGQARAPRVRLSDFRELVDLVIPGKDYD